MSTMILRRRQSPTAGNGAGTGTVAGMGTVTSVVTEGGIIAVVVGEDGTVVVGEALSGKRKSVEV